ncbi:8657_t:CDS:2, partial [Scutellospora calospora]
KSYFLDENFLGSTSILANYRITNNTELVISEINEEAELSIEIEPNDESSLQLLASTSYMSWDLAELDDVLLSVHILEKLGKHNHQIQPDVTLFASKYRKLFSEILEVVEFYVTKGKMSSKQILLLLTAKFLDYIIHKRDLYNAVQKF